MKIRYEYMILYVFPNGNGKTYITRNRKISSIEDAEEIDIWLRSDDCILGITKELKEKVYATDFKLLGKYISK